MKIEGLEQDQNMSKTKKWLLKLLIDAVDHFKEDVTSWEAVFTRRTVDELLFGYEDPILKVINKLASSLVPDPVFAFSVS